jgi:hypothetical protein
MVRKKEWWELTLSAIGHLLCLQQPVLRRTTVSFATEEANSYICCGSNEMGDSTASASASAMECFCAVSGIVIVLLK